MDVGVAVDVGVDVDDVDDVDFDVDNVDVDDVDAYVVVMKYRIDIFEDMVGFLYKMFIILF